MVRTMQQRDCPGRMIDQLAQPPHLGQPRTLGHHRPGRLVPLVQDSDDLAIFVADRGEAVIPIGFVRPPAAHHVEPLVERGKALARCDHLGELRTDDIPDFGEHVLAALAQRPGMPLGGDRCPGVIVEQPQLFAPVNRGGNSRSHANAQRKAQWLGPILGRADRVAPPRMLPDHAAHFTAMIEKTELRIHGATLRCAPASVNAVAPRHGAQSAYVWAIDRERRG